MKKLALVTILSVSAFACGGPLKYHVVSTPKAPGADADITAEIKKDEGRTEMTVKVENLAPADRVCGGKSFVGWYKAGDHPWTRIGAIKFEDGERKAEVKWSAPEISFDFQITCEAEASVPSPSAEIIFAQPVNH